jgi:uncharacterized protein (TIGR02246 family)
MVPTPTQVRALLKTWAAALKSTSVDRVLELYAPDAILLPTVKPGVYKGSTKIRVYFEGLLKKLPSVVLDEIHTRCFDGLAVASGLYTFHLANPDTPAGDPSELPSRFVFVYVWTGSDWIIVEHHSSLSPDLVQKALAGPPSSSPRLGSNDPNPAPRSQASEGPKQRRKTTKKSSNPPQNA